MKAYLNAMYWAGAMLVVAVADAAGAIDHSSATVLLATLPALMIATSGRRCGRATRGA